MDNTVEEYKKQFEFLLEVFTTKININIREC